MELNDPVLQAVETRAAYAGFWIRFVAAFIDGMIVGVAQSIVMFPFLGLPWNEQVDEYGDPVLFSGAILASWLVSLVFNWLYEAFMESGKRQATVGKMALGLKVTDMSGNRISFANATGRHFAKYLSAIILLIGYIMAAFTQKKQALHDVLADTLVVYDR